MFTANKQFARGIHPAQVSRAFIWTALFILPCYSYGQQQVLNVLAASECMPVCTEANDQINPDITPDGNGGTIIVWQDIRSGNNDIYAQRTNVAGNVLWSTDGVAICTAGGSQELPRIISDDSGGAIIIWQDYRNGSSDIYAQRVTDGGSVLWADNGIPVCTSVFDQFNIDAVKDGLGGVILTWEDYRSNVVNCPDIYAQRVSSDGTILWTANGVTVCNEASAQHGPRIAGDDSGGAFITWYDQRAGDYDIYTQRVASGGAVQWTTNGVATCTSATDQLMPDICTDGAGGVIITWHDYRSTNEYDIYAQRQGPDGAVVWAVDGVVMNNNVGYDQINPVIVSDGVGGAVMAWQDYRTGITSDIYAQRVAPAGAVMWTATGVMICTAEGDQINPQIVTNGNSGAFVTWEDYRSISNSDIYAQLIASNSEINWPATGYLICDADGNQSFPTMADDGNFGAVVAWQDQRNGNWDIYAEGFGLFGTGIETSPETDGTMPHLSRARPNPATDVVSFAFTLPGSGTTELALFDMTGRRVATVAGGLMTAGQHEVLWNTSSERAGVYFCRLTFGGATKTSRLVILR